MYRILTRVGRRGALLGTALAAVAAGVAVLSVAVAGQYSPPQAPASARGSLRPPPTGNTATGIAETPTLASRPSGDPQTPATRQRHHPLPRSVPVSISIPAIGVRSEVFPIGKTAGGALQAPRPGPRLNQAAWFENSPTPGQPGPSIIEGHVDTAHGPSVFFRLGDVRPGDRVTVTRRDDTTVVFTVDAVRDFPKKRFPTRLVYGGNLSEPTLRLITCSDFDESIGHHTGNLVVFAHRTAVKHPYPRQHG